VVKNEEKKDSGKGNGREKKVLAGQNDPGKLKKGKPAENALLQWLNSKKNERNIKPQKRTRRTRNRKGPSVKASTSKNIQISSKRKGGEGIILQPQRERGGGKN